MLSGIFLVESLFGIVIARAFERVSNPHSFFHTRPDLQAPILTVELSQPELLNNGYLFFSTYQSTQNGPLIFDNCGNLIWSGSGAFGPGVAHNIKVCTYRNESHLCFFQGAQMVGYGRGHGVIMDKHYQVVKVVHPAGSQMFMDLHEFNLQDDGNSALMTIYQPRPYDLCEWGVTSGVGWVQDGIFQEVDTATGYLCFEWRSLDHISPHESLVQPATTEISGDGIARNTPWDYFHINSVDKNSEGDYLISARHTCTIYKISGQDGSIIWRLNGIGSDYTLVDFDFAYQHDARWISDNETHSVISLFDNGSNGFSHTRETSRGIVVTLEHQTQTARMLATFTHPYRNGAGLRAASQGNMQVLPDGHIVQGWGPNCYITEHLADGTPIFSAWVARVGVMIYRIYKFQWRGEPLWNPSVWSYSKDRADTTIYASWNGATEYTKWRFYGAQDEHGPWVLAGTANRTGFETTFHHHVYFPFVYAAAERDGIVLKASRIETPFSPGPDLKEKCNNFSCPPATRMVSTPGTRNSHEQRSRLRSSRYYRTLLQWQTKTERVALLIFSGALILFVTTFLNRSIRAWAFAGVLGSVKYATRTFRESIVLCLDALDQ